jgi:hypothetical protein
VVELSGIVLEGASGFRAEKAVMTGPVKLTVPCGGVGDRHCDQRATLVGGAPTTSRGVPGLHRGRASWSRSAGHRRVAGDRGPALEARIPATHCPDRRGGRIMDIGPVERVWEVEPIELPAEIRRSSRSRVT